MTRSAVSDVKLKIQSVLRHLTDDGYVSAITMGGWVTRDRLRDGVNADQANRAWEYTATLASGESDDLNIRTMSGLDVGAGDGNDGLGQTMLLEELVGFCIDHVSGAGSLEIMATDPANKLAWVPTLSGTGALKAGGAMVMYQPDIDALNVVNDTYEILRLSAVGGGVNYRVCLLARDDDQASSSSSSTSSSTNSSSCSTSSQSATSVSSSSSSSMSCSSVSSSSSTQSVSTASSVSTMSSLSTSSSSSSVSSSSSSSSTQASGVSSSSSSSSTGQLSTSSCTSLSSSTYSSSSTQQETTSTSSESSTVQQSTSSTIARSTSSTVARTTSSDSWEPLLLGWLDAWSDSVQAAMVANPIANPVTDPSGYSANLYAALNYDGVLTNWRLSEIERARGNTGVADAIFDYAKGMALTTMNYYLLDEDTTPDPIGNPGGSTGYYNYVTGLKVLSMDSRLSNEEKYRCRLMACNLARASAFAAPFYPIAEECWYGNTLMPLLFEGSGLAGDGLINENRANLVREYSLCMLSYLVTSDILSEFETRQYNCYGGAAFGYRSYVDGAAQYIEQIIDAYQIGSTGLLGRWRDIGNQLAAAGGDFTQVPDSWTVYGFDTLFVPHMCRSLIYYHDDPHDDTRNTVIRAAVIECADLMYDYFYRAHTAVDGSGFIYGVPSGGTPLPEPSADLTWWQFPLFAWCYKETGNAVYYDVCVELAKLGQYAWWGTGKHRSEQSNWMWDGLYWIGWLDQLSWARNTYTPIFWNE